MRCNSVLMLLLPPAPLAAADLSAAIALLPLLLITLSFLFLALERRHRYGNTGGLDFDAITELDWANIDATATDDPAAADFRHRFVGRGIPVCLRGGASSWNAVRMFRPTLFERLGRASDVEVLISYGVEETSGQTIKSRMSLAAFAKTMQQGGAVAASSSAVGAETETGTERESRDTGYLKQWAALSEWPSLWNCTCPMTENSKLGVPQHSDWCKSVGTNNSAGSAFPHADTRTDLASALRGPKGLFPAFFPCSFFAWWPQFYFGDLFIWMGNARRRRRVVGSGSSGDVPSCRRTGTGLHNDDEDNILVQLRGRKRVTLCPPWQWRHVAINSKYDEGTVTCDADAEAASGVLGEQEAESARKRHPTIVNATLRCIDLEAGDILFIPRYWFHQVRPLESGGNSGNDNDNGNVLTGIGGNGNGENGKEECCCYCSISLNYFVSTPWQMYRDGVPRMIGAAAHAAGWRKGSCVCHASTTLPPKQS